MATTMDLVNRLLASGNYRGTLSVIKGFRNGAVYGAKIRFPHALVMTFLFKGGPLWGQAKAVLEATFTHSKNLASFVFIYKALTNLFMKIQSQQKQYHAFVAAFIGGYFVFGKYNKINEQINLYLLSRIVYGLVKLLAEKGYIPKPKSDPFPWFAASAWGVAVWMTMYHRQCLQSSMAYSGKYLYDDSNVWHSIRDFLIYNK